MDSQTIHLILTVITTVIAVIFAWLSFFRWVKGKPATIGAKIKARKVARIRAQETKKYIKKFEELGLEYDESYINSLTYNNPAGILISSLRACLLNVAPLNEDLVYRIVKCLGADNNNVISANSPWNMCRIYLKDSAPGILLHSIYTVIGVDPAYEHFFWPPEIQKTAETASDWCDEEWLKIHKMQVIKHDKEKQAKGKQETKNT